MSEPQPPETDRPASPYLRLPLPVVAGGIAVVLIALLALGLYANRNVRQPVAVPATPSPPLASATPVPAAAATPVPVPTATLASTPLVLVIEPSETATAAPPTPSPVAAGQLNGTSSSPTPLPTVEPELAAEVARAYEDFWRVTSRALLELDTNGLADVMDGDYLSNITRRITELRAEGRAIKTRVILNYTVVTATSELASVVDDFEDDSVYVRIGTEDRLTEPMTDRYRVLYRLRNSSGVWKVFDSARSE